jgi:hypothetical protein
MTDKLHGLFDVNDGIHVIQAWDFADVSARADWTYDEVADVGKVAHMLDDDSFWLLSYFSEGAHWEKLTQQLANEVVNTNSLYGVNDVGSQLDYLYTRKAEALLNIRAHTGTADTLVLADAGQLVTSSNVAGVTQTIPSNAAVAFQIGTVVQLVQLGAGQVSLAITADTLRLPPGFVAKLRGQYSSATLTKIAATTWLASGDLAFV